MRQTIQLTLPADMKYSSFVRRVSEDVFRQIGFSSDWSGRLKLVMDELFMNANRYGSSSKESQVHICFSFDDTEVIFTVEDEGKLPHINAQMLLKIIDQNIVELADPEKTNGRGLALISHLWTDAMTIQDSAHGGIAISFTKRIARDRPPTPPGCDHKK